MANEARKLVLGDKELEALVTELSQMEDQGEKYHLTVFNRSGEYVGKVDLYDVLDSLTLEGPGAHAIAHAIKKLAFAGRRGHKSKAKDLREAVWSLVRAVQQISVQVAAAEDAGV